MFSLKKGSLPVWRRAHFNQQKSFGYRRCGCGGIGLISKSSDRTNLLMSILLSWPILTNYFDGQHARRCDGLQLPHTERLFGWIAVVGSGGSRD